MIGNIGFGEVLLIALVLVLVFSTSRLPALGDALGRGLRSLRRSGNDGPGSNGKGPVGGAPSDPPPQ